MKNKIKFEFCYPDDLFVIETITMDFTSWNAVMKFGERHSQALMITLNLNAVVWDYTVLLDENA